MGRFIIALVFLFIFIGQIFAGNNKEIDIGEVISTANRIEVDSKNAPGNTDVVNKKDIILRPNAKFSDTIRGLDGVRIPKGRGMETFDSITLRGISGGTSVLIDGVGLNDMNNNTKMLTSMSAMDLEKVEIVRGPFSSLYGSGALGGVVNFITKMSDKLEVNANIGYGNPFIKNNASQNLVRGYISFGDSYFDKAFRIKASYGWTTSKGYAADDAWSSSVENGVSGYRSTLSADGTERYIVGDMGRQSYANHDARIRGQVDINDNGTFDIGFNYSNYNYIHTDQTSFLRKDGDIYWGSAAGSIDGNGIAGSIPYAYVGGMGNEKNNQFVEFIKYKHFFENSILEVNLSRLDGINFWLGPNGDGTPWGGTGKKVKTLHQKTSGDIFYNIDFYEWFGLLVGIDYKLLEMDVTNVNIQDWRYFGSGERSFAGASGGKSHFIGAFAELKGNFLNEMLIMSLGGRFDYWKGMDYYNIDKDSNGLPTKGNNKSAFSPKFSLIYNPLKTTALKFSIGQAFRVPTLNQMFSTHILNDGTQVLGNPNLKPETATSFDIGIEQKSALNGTFKAFYFFTHLANAIYQDNATSMYENAGAARLQGIELSYKQPLPLNLGIYASYTFTHSKMLKNSTNPTSIGKYLPGIPLHLGYIQIYYEDYGFYGSFGGEFMSKPYRNADNSDSISKVYGSTDAYAIFDLKFGYNFNKYLGLSLDVTNIFNYKYYSYYRAPGSAFFLSLNAKY